MEFLAPLIRQLLDVCHPQTIIEVGAARGKLTGDLCDWATANHSFLQVVSPLLSKPLFQLMMKCKHAQLHLGKTLEKLGQLEPAACYFIYDDFNYYSIFQQLRLIMAHGTPDTLFIFGTGWPTGRRDLYGDPSLIPAAYLHDNIIEKDIFSLFTFLRNSGKTDFLPAWTFHMARKQGGPRNGVLTAVEDIVAETSGYTFFKIDVDQGLGIVLRQDLGCLDEALQILEAYTAKLPLALPGYLSSNSARQGSTQPFDGVYNAEAQRTDDAMTSTNWWLLRSKADDLYLQLVKKALLDALYTDAEKPKIESQGNSFTVAEIRQLGTDWPERALTMIGMERLNNVEYCVEDVLWNNIPGDLVETGVWRGGTCIFMRAILKMHAVTNRTVWVADSFKGLPPPNSQKYPHDENIKLSDQKQLVVSRQEVERNFESFDLLDDQVHFLEGWFKDTLPNAPIEQIAVLRLDGDLYESTMDALTALYPKVSPGGYIIVDDFGAISACRQAVLDYREQYGIADAIHTIDWTGVYWQRSLSQDKTSAPIESDLR